jgi:hypothetical protein
MSTTLPSLRQSFEVPNSQKLSLFAAQGSFNEPTLAGSTIIAVGTYSYDITAAGTLVDDLKQVYPDENNIADTSGPTRGHQNFQTFVLQNAKALFPTDKLTYTIQGTDWLGLWVGEFTGVLAASLVGVAAAWQQNVGGGGALMSPPISLPPGNYLVFATSINTSDSSNQAPYAPIAVNVNSVGTWFVDDSLGNGAQAFPIGTLATALLNPTVETSFAAQFAMAPEVPPTGNDNAVTILVVLKASASVSPPPQEVAFRGTLNVAGRVGHFSGTVPSTAISAAAEPFTGEIDIGGSTAAISGTIPVATTPPPPPPVPTISGFSPTTGKPLSAVQITGSGFLAVSKVMIGSTNVPGFVIQSDTVIALNIPASASSGQFTVTDSSGSALSAATFTVQTTAPPPPNDFWVYSNTQSPPFGWAGDWSGIPVDYASPNPGVNGQNPCCRIAATSEKNEYWLPYPKPNFGGPASNGVNFLITPYDEFTIAVKPSQPGLQLSMGFYKANGATDDIPVGVGVTITQAKYGPAAMTVGQYNIYTIPLADFQLGDLQWIYKFIIQEQGSNTDQQIDIDQCGFLAA